MVSELTNLAVSTEVRNKETLVKVELVLFLPTKRVAPSLCAWWE